MFALLGDIKFDLVTYFDGLTSRRGVKYARQEVIAGKPRLQRVGTDLDELKIDLSFHDYYCDPVAELKRIDAAIAEGQALPLIWGDGIVEGVFVVESREVTHQTASKAGRVSALTATLVLTEYVEPKPIESAARKKKAEAKGRKKAGKAKKTGTKTARPGTTRATNQDGVSYTKVTRN